MNTELRRVGGNVFVCYCKVRLLQRRSWGEPRSILVVVAGTSNWDSNRGHVTVAAAVFGMNGTLIMKVCWKCKCTCKRKFCAI